MSSSDVSANRCTNLPLERGLEEGAQTVTRSPEQLLELVHSLWKREAESGKDAPFAHWTFLDTNCISELVKRVLAAKDRPVLEFLANRTVLITGPVLIELTKVPDLLSELDCLVGSTEFYIVPNMNKFFEADLWNFFDGGETPRNVLEATRVKPGLLSVMAGNESFLKTFLESEASAREQFFEKVGPDIGATLDERVLTAIVWKKVSDLAEEHYKTEIPIPECHPGNFPSFFAFYYSYYYRYIRPNDVRPQFNDFHDLENTKAAPYCTSYFAEATFANLLRTQVSGHKPPSSYASAKMMRKKGSITVEQFRAVRANATLHRKEVAMLPRTRIYTYRELCERLEA